MKISENIYAFIDEIVAKTEAENPKWGEVFKKCFLNTLETTVKVNEDGTVFVLTGDIPAMWLRDSTAQVRPYLLLAPIDEKISDIIAGLVEQQFRYIIHDPYANAFNRTEDGSGHQDDHTDMTPLIWERKYEIDSLCYPIQLAYLLYKNTGRTDHFNQTFIDGVKEIVNLWIVEQDHTNSPYTFVRDTDREEDTLINDGRGSEVAVTGMTWSGFRPSDDRCIYHYLVPSNMFAVVVLDYLVEIADIVDFPEGLVDQISTLRAEIQTGIENHAIVENKAGEKVYAYEVDGLGNYSLTDDPNVPSLLSLPYLGYCEEDDELYQATRRMIFSKENPYYFEGEYARGLGSSHTWDQYIWPIALSMEGLTTSDRNAKRDLLNTLVNTDGGTYLMHESFDVNDPTKYSREWFSWSNMMFCELLLDYYGQKVKR
ncbi:glycoside hydrolase family 125 protein [Fundicoccus sp. Sow4_H7]|uniref:glycoside hydrolase family 125 protein n=1 Tax=Fundicoccus sp. Sow4_H7 TaxID=3438784 RepID=UPI003F92E283